MDSIVLHGGLPPLLLALLILSGCGPTRTIDCASLEEGTHSLGPPSQHTALVDSMEIMLADMCSRYAALRDSLEITPVAGDTTALTGQISSLVEHQIEMDSVLHATLMVWGSEILDERAPGDLVSVSTRLRVGSLDTPPPLATRLQALSDHVTRFDSASASSREQIRTARAGRAGSLLRLHVSLVDSLHELLRNSMLRGTFTEEGQLSSQLDSLASVLARIGAVHAVHVDMHAAYVDSVGGGVLLLGIAAERMRRREFIWQIRQEAGLLHELLSLLEALSENFSGESNRLSGVWMEQTVDRLRDLTDVLMAHSGSLEGLHSQLSGAPSDSLRLVTGLIQDELLRQKYILTELERSLAVVEEADRSQRPIQLLEGTTALYLGVHDELEALTDALLLELGNEFANYGVKIILTILVLALCIALTRTINWLMNMLSERQASRRLFYKRLIPVMRLTAWGIALYVVLAYIFQLDQRSLLAAGAAVAVAVGFAAQDIVKNVFGGIIIIFDQTFQVGDKIRVGGTYGEVISIGLRATRIVTPDDNEVTVPNAHVIDSQVANANTGSLNCQVIVELYVPGWTDVMEAKAIAYSAAANSKYVYMGKPIVVNVQDVFKETFLTKLTVKAYVLDTRYEYAFASDVAESAKAEFKYQGFFRQLESGKEIRARNP